MIVSNPPYIKQEEFKTLQPEVQEFEPRLALADETNGGIFYDLIARSSKRLLKENGAVFVEIGAGNTQEVKNIFQSCGFRNFEIKNDLSGIERVIKATY